MKSLMWLAYWLTLLPGRKGCQATEHPDNQNETPVAWGGGSEVRGRGL